MSERRKGVSIRERPIDLRIAIPVFWNQDIDAPLAAHKGKEIQRAPEVYPLPFVVWVTY